MQGFGLRMRSGVPSWGELEKRQDKGRALLPGWVLGLRLEPGCGREGSRLANALVTMCCDAADLAASRHLCSGKRINLYLY